MFDIGLCFPGGNGHREIGRGWWVGDCVKEKECNVEELGEKLTKVGGKEG